MSTSRSVANITAQISQKDSNAAGTRRYMAPEWTTQADRAENARTYESAQTKLENLKTLDIYALGIILCELLCNPRTAMEQMRIDDAIRAPKPQLPRGYKLEGLPEADLLLKLVDPDPKNRPTIEEVRAFLTDLV